MAPDRDASECQEGIMESMCVKENQDASLFKVALWIGLGQETKTELEWQKRYRQGVSIWFFFYRAPVPSASMHARVMKPIISIFKKVKVTRNTYIVKLHGLPWNFP